MKIYYARVRFSFGDYIFYTYDDSFKGGDHVLCLVRQDLIVGSFIGYVDITDVPNGELKPIYGITDTIVSDFSRKETQYLHLRSIEEKKKEEKEILPTPLKLSSSREYFPGDMVRAGDFIWKMNCAFEFFKLGTIDDWVSGKIYEALPNR